MTGMRRAVLVSAGWIAAAAAFGVVVSLWRGGGAGQEYFAAYLIEKALSIDNVFVFALVFRAFAVPAAYQHRVLFAGVLGALAMRAGFISAGAALLEQLSWAGYVFGALLVAAALRMARGGAGGDPRRGLVMRGLRKVMPVTESYDGTRFLTRREGKLFATPLLAVLLVIETMDVIFAIDSIPAALGVTTDVFIVVTSNAFAVLGLRALYFVLAGAMERFAFLSTGLAVMLAFIGAKMLLAGVVHVSVAVSLGVIVVVIACAVLLSVWQLHRRGAAARRAHADAGAGHTEPFMAGDRALGVRTGLAGVSLGRGKPCAAWHKRGARAVESYRGCRAGGFGVASTETAIADGACVSEEQTLRQAGHLMRELGVEELGVRGEDGEFCGVISEDMVVRRIAAGGDPKTVTVGETLRRSPRGRPQASRHGGPRRSASARRVVSVP
jgi:tellurite resistance protein TerC